MSRDRELKAGTPGYVRVTFLEDELFPTFSRFFLASPSPTLRLGRTEFVVTTVLATPESGNEWSSYVSYDELITRNAHCRKRRIELRFITPTSFRARDVDLPLPLPRLVFQSYVRRFQEFCDFQLLPDVIELVEQHTGIARMDHMRTDTITTNKTVLNGFVGEVTFVIGKKAPLELVGQMHLLADFAFFCGTGKKTAVGMGQTATGIK
jgi:CRISPR-associated endoribonuclease Cas6